MALRQARILSSETDNTIKQEQNTNVNIKITPRAPTKPQTIPVNFTLPEQQQSLGPASFAHSRIKDSPEGQQQPNQDLHSQTVNQDYQSQSAATINSLCQERGIADLGTEINDLEKKNSFLEMIVQMYESNPLKVNSYVVCESKLLMDMIKLLTECDKVELVIDDSDVGCGCTASAKFIKVAKILITKDGKTEDMKYAYNDIYSQFIKYGISLKLVI